MVTIRNYGYSQKERILKSSIKHFFSPHRILAICSLLILSVAFALSLILEPDAQTWIPFPRISIRIINGLCAALCLVLIVNPEIKWIELSILCAQSFFTIWTGYETLGIFLYSAFVFLLFCYGFFKRHFKRRVLLLILFWIIELLGVIPHGIPRTILAYVTAFFMLAFYYMAFNSLKIFLAPLLPVQDESAKIKLLPTEGKINLNRCDLSELELKLLIDFLEENATYEQLGQKHNMSTSTVKKYMSKVLKTFGVKNNIELRTLLQNRYTID